MKSILFFAVALCGTIIIPTESQSTETQPMTNQTIVCEKCRPKHLVCEACEALTLNSEKLISCGCKKRGKSETEKTC